jgi:hypothetical protein
MNNNYGKDKRLLSKLNSLLINSNIPWWEWNIKENKVIFNDLKVTMLGYKIEDFKDVGYEAFTSLIHIEDYERAMDAMRDLLYGRASIYQVDYRIKDVRGSYHWYLDRGTAIEKDPAGVPLILRGIVLDMGEYISEELYHDKVMHLMRASLTVLTKLKEGQIVVCSNCMKMKITINDWIPVSESFFEDAGVDISHTVCPNCIRLLYPEIAEKVLAQTMVVSNTL